MFSGGRERVYWANDFLWGGNTGNADFTYNLYISYKNGVYLNSLQK